MPYDSSCCSCPYRNQKHLPAGEQTQRADPPVDLEYNGSDTLIVLQAPGEEEWRCGRPLMAVKKKGGTAGERVRKSWDRKGKKREDFDIIEAVQCYPGRGTNNRDEKPNPGAVQACTYRLYRHLIKRKYKKIVALGETAHNASKNACCGLNIKIVRGGGIRREGRRTRIWIACGETRERSCRGEFTYRRKITSVAAMRTLVREHALLVAQDYASAKLERHCFTHDSTSERDLDPSDPSAKIRFV